MMKNNLKVFSRVSLTAAVLLSIYIPSAHSAACTYDEGILAYQQKNLIRAKVLLEMAKRDGDNRAELFLLKHFDVKVKALQVASK